MRRALPFLLAALLVFTGCAASGTTIRPTPETVKGYEVGETYEANTGSSILTGGKIRTRPSYSPTRTITPPGRGLGESEGPELTPDQRWVAVKQLTEGGYLLRDPRNDRRFIAINTDGSVKDAGWYQGVGGNTNSMDNGEWPTEQIFEEGEAVPMEGSFEFEILYSGTDGETVKMTYREYVDGMQRADYSQDLSYNVAEQDTVNFRSIRMHIKEAGSSSIRFEVIEDGGLPWLPR